MGSYAGQQAAGRKARNTFVIKQVLDRNTFNYSS